MTVPKFHDAPPDQNVVANFANLIEIYEMELHMPVRMAHKLNHRVLYPGPIERQSVQVSISPTNLYDNDNETESSYK
jgi:hypothetical protein